MSSPNSKELLDTFDFYVWSNEAGQLFLSVTHISSESLMLSTVRRLQESATKLGLSLLVKQSNCTLEMFWQVTPMLHSPSLKFLPSSILTNGKAISVPSLEMLIRATFETVLPLGSMVLTVST